jgi:hypothetical protein
MTFCWKSDDDLGNSFVLCMCWLAARRPCNVWRRDSAFLKTRLSMSLDVIFCASSWVSVVCVLQRFFVYTHPILFYQTTAVVLDT